MISVDINSKNKYFFQIRIKQLPLNKKTARIHEHIVNLPAEFVILIIKRNISKEVVFYVYAIQQNETYLSLELVTFL